MVEQDIENTIYCWNCKYPNATNAKFCGGCGRPLPVVKSLPVDKSLPTDESLPISGFGFAEFRLCSIVVLLNFVSCVAVTCYMLVQLFMGMQVDGFRVGCLIGIAMHGYVLLYLAHQFERRREEKKL